MLVVDASVLVVALTDDGERGDRARSRLDDEELMSPDLVDLEVLSVLRRALHHGEVSVGRADAAVKTLARLSLERVPHRSLAARCWELRDLTPYDAAYVALCQKTLGADARHRRRTAGSGSRPPVPSSSWCAVGGPLS